MYPDLENVSPKEIAIAAIFEDHKLFADSLAYSLEHLSFFQSIHFFNREIELLDFVEASFRKNKVYVFVDFFIENGNSLELIMDIRKSYPSVRVIVVSSLTSSGMIRKISAQKISGYISKIDSFEELRRCIGITDTGHTYLSASVRKIMLSENTIAGVNDISARELEILKLLSMGKGTSDIAEELNISINTVMTHRKRILYKLNCSSISEAISYSIRNGIVSL